MKIFLIGFMGSGKTTTGKKLAKILNFDFYDLDQMIEQDENKTIDSIFEEDGEEKFRWLERNALKKSIITLSNSIISTGGGTPCFVNNMDLMNKSGITVYLELDEKSILNRLLFAKESRPLIKKLSEDELRIFISEQLSIRKPFYQRSKITFSALSPNYYQLGELIKSLE
ncbi:MAG: shikimate kinase [Bacteroidales bacterium]|nr:shikimate kinase [Bacteroidales bacterium]